MSPNTYVPVGGDSVLDFNSINFSFGPDSNCGAVFATQSRLTGSTSKRSYRSVTAKGFKTSSESAFGGGVHPLSRNRSRSSTRSCFLRMKADRLVVAVGRSSQ
jgi:hypothetical protein